MTSTLKPARLLLAVAVVATALVAGGASAAPAKACNLIVDPANDTFLVRAQDSQKAYGPQEDALDIVSGDIATDSTRLTAVLRTKKLALRAGTAPNGLAFRVSFNTPGSVASDRHFYVDGRVEGNGSTAFTAGYRPNLANSPSTKLADVTGVVDEKASEVRITAPLSVWAQIDGGIKPGMLLDLTGVDHTTGRYTVTNPTNNAGAASPFADVAASERTYKAGAPSCVVVGK